VQPIRASYWPWPPRALGRIRSYFSAASMTVRHHAWLHLKILLYLSISSYMIDCISCLFSFKHYTTETSVIELGKFCSQTASFTKFLKLVSTTDGCMDVGVDWTLRIFPRQNLRRLILHYIELFS
jgi:hypothetical protein